MGTGALGALGAVFVIDPILGSRDWDISCLSGIPLMCLSTYAFYNCGLKESTRNYASVFSCVCAALLVVRGFISITRIVPLGGSRKFWKMIPDHITRPIRLK